MKQFLLFLLITALTGCQKKAIGPAELLYNRWQLVQVQEANDAPQKVATQTLISFAVDGKIDYDEAGYKGDCCVPRRFARNNQTLLLDYSTGQPEYCKYVDIACRSPHASGPEWVIKQLDGQQLVLQAGNILLMHKRAY